MNVPFYRNPDDSHCFQASLKMTIEAFYPDKIMSFLELDGITCKDPDLYTWPFAGMEWMLKNGFEVLIIENFDMIKFISDPTNYLIEFYGYEVGSDQISNSDISSVVKWAKKSMDFMARIKEERIPTFEDICSLLKRGYLLIVNINANVIWGNQGYCGHFIVIKDFEDDILIINDSGDFHGENQRIQRSKFEEAWYYPDSNAGNCYAFKRRD